MTERLIPPTKKEKKKKYANRPKNLLRPVRKREGKKSSRRARGLGRTEERHHLLFGLEKKEKVEGAMTLLASSMPLLVRSARKRGGSEERGQFSLSPRGKTGVPGAVERKRRGGRTQAKKERKRTWKPIFPSGRGLEKDNLGRARKLGNAKPNEKERKSAAEDLAEAGKW